MKDTPGRCPAPAQGKITFRSVIDYEGDVPVIQGISLDISRGKSGPWLVQAGRARAQYST